MLFKQKKISAFLGMLIGSIPISHDVRAQIAPPPDYDQRLSNVIINATRSGTPLDEIPLNTTVLTKEVIETSPDQTIDQVLKNTPGVLLNDVPYYQKDPTAQSINVRGLGNARTLVMVDGVPLNDAFYGTIQWNLVPLSSIDTVEFIRGGVSSLWGNYGMGGVINVNTKNPKNSQQDISASYGSFATGNFSAAKDIVASDSLQLRFSADYFGTEGYQNIATIQPASPANIGSGQNSPWSKNTNMRLQGNFKASQSTDGFFRVGYSTMQDTSSNYGFATNLKQDSSFAGGTTTRVDDSSKIQANLYYENTIFNKQNGSSAAVSTSLNPAQVATGTGYISANYQNPYSTLGGSVQYTKESKGLIDQYVAAVDIRSISGSNLGNNLTTTGGSSTTNYAKGQQNFSGLMGQIKSKSEVIPLETTLAARVDYWTSQTPSYYNTGANGLNPSYQNIPNQSKTQLSPTLGLLYKLSKDWDLRSAAYQAFHAPGMNNTLRSYASSTGGNFFANPNLSPETMTGYEFGSDYRWKEGFFQATAFNNFVKNAIATYSLSSTSASDVALAQSLCGVTNGSNPLSAAAGNCVSKSITYYTNNQNLQSQGLEFQFHHDLNPKWAVDAGYAYTKTWLTSTTTSDAPYIGNQLGGVPANIGNAGLTYYPVPKASFTTNIRYVGNSWMNTSHSLPVPAYAVVGIRANYELTQQASIFASVVNLFNRNYITFNSATQATSYQAGMPQAIAVGARIIF
jgi:iron complex outermembrane receptor protein